MPYFARILEGRATSHIHAHFAREATESALLISILLGIGFSFTAHAYDIYMKPRGLRKKMERAALIIASSQATATYLRGISGEEGNKKIVLVYNGVETDIFHPRESVEKREVFTVLCVASLIEKKGITFLLQGFKIVLDRGLALRLLIIGDGPEKGPILELAQDMELGDSFQLSFSNEETREELAGIYRTVSLFVLPSIVSKDGNQEGIPSVIMEAMASGLPVIATRTGGIPEIVRDGETGILVNPGSSQEIAKAIMRIFENPDLSRVMGQMGRRRIEAEFDYRRNGRVLSGYLCEFIH